MRMLVRLIGGLADCSFRFIMGITVGAVLASPWMVTHHLGWYGITHLFGVLAVIVGLILFFGMLRSD